MKKDWEDAYKKANEEIHWDHNKKEEVKKQLAKGAGTGSARVFRIAAMGCAWVLGIAFLLVMTNGFGLLGGMQLRQRFISSALSSLGKTATTVAAAEYPEADVTGDGRDRWWEFRDTYGAYSNELLEAMGYFTIDTALSVLGEETDDNLCYSPVSLYTALAMAAETAGGETREEILKALHYVYPDGVVGTDHNPHDEKPGAAIDCLAEDMFRYLSMQFEDNALAVSKIANSLWLNEDMLDPEDLRQDTAELLAQKYMVSSYRGSFSKDDMGKAMANWIVKQTRGLLGGGDQALEVDENTAMTMISTVYYYDQWYDKFKESNNVVEAFYKADGSTVKAEYMCMTKNPYPVLAEEGYTAAGMSMKGGSRILFVLPDEGWTPADLLADKQIMAQILELTEESETQYGEVRFKIPKYQFRSSVDLTETVKSLGIELAFSSEKADFSGLLAGENAGEASSQGGQMAGEEGGNPLWLSSIQQQTSMSIDENGCEAAAFTMLQYAGAAMPEDRIIEFTLNRPFLIVIWDGGPLFVGVINEP